ncbi:hypothetical protein EV174_001184 [Coemansia sp. RSA 2320]|nr:hypothetical protein EV174_001184 [Coemansia sp. RSA 2320]
MSHTIDRVAGSADVLLQISACTDTTQLACILARTPLDPLTIVANVPECLNVGELADILFALKYPPSYPADATNSCGDGADEREPWPVPSAQWVSACIARAEAIDQWTGRIDWAVRWLERVRAQGLHDPADALALDRALRNALVLGYMAAAGREGAGLSSLALSAVNSFSQADFVDQVMRACGGNAVPPPALDTVARCTDSDAELKSAWNCWWAQNILGTTRGLMPALIASHPLCFDAVVVLTAVYSVGGPCSDACGAKAALGVLAQSSGSGSLGDCVEFPPSTLEKIHSLTAHTLLDTLKGLPDDDVVAIANTGLAQVRAAEVAQCFGLDIDIPSIVACQDSAEDQRRLLQRLLASAQRHQSTLVQQTSLWESLQLLHTLRLFGCLSVDNLKQSYLRLLLSCEQFEEAQMLVDAEPPFAEETVVLQTACEVARELFDNAEPSSMDKGLMKAARRCLDIIPQKYQQDIDVRRERALIQAAHLVWTLDASALPLFQSQRASTTGGLYPIELRLSADPYVLVKTILDSYPGAYKKQRIVREISGKLLEVAGLSSTLESAECVSPDPDLGTRRDLGVRSVSEGFTAALMLQSAIDAGDFSEGYNFARQLINARAMLGKALRTVEEYRSAQLLADHGSDSKQPVEMRAVEAIWTSSVKLARAWSAAGTSAHPLATDRQLEVVSLALSLCPTGDIAELLKLWNDIQSRALGRQSDASAVSWALPVENLDDPLACIQQMLVGCQPAQPTAAPSSDDQAVSLETMRTFDPAIIKRCLRFATAPASTNKPTLGAEGDVRCSLLMAWLEFALLTAKEPTGEHSAEFRHQVEADIVRRYSEAACHTLASRIFPQVDCTNYTALERFYAFYARCLEASGDKAGAEQALARVSIVRRIKKRVELCEYDFARLVRALLAQKPDCHAALRFCLSETAVMSLVELAPDLAKLAFLPGIDVIDDCERVLDDAGRWQAEELAGKLCLWTLLDTLRGGLAEEREPDVLPSRFLRLLALCLPAMSDIADLAALVDCVVFDRSIADSLSLACRVESTTWCLERAGSADQTEAADSRRVLCICRAYLEFVAEMEALRDPFTFAKLSHSWARAFDVASGAIVLSSSSAVGDVCAQCIGVLEKMIVGEVSAYFVCRAYLCTRQLVMQWGGEASAVPGLAQVYAGTLCSIIAEAAHDDLACDELVARQLVAVAEPPLELCSFDYGDSALGGVLAQFKREFGTDMSDIIHGRYRQQQHEPSEAQEPLSPLSSSAKLALLDVLARYCSGLHRVASEADELSHRAAAGRAGGGIGEPDFLQFQLLADKLWGFALPSSGGRGIDDLCGVWLLLLERTDPLIAAADGQIDTLVRLLVKWAGDGGPGGGRPAECWAELLRWAARSKRPARVVLALVQHPEHFTGAVGCQVFDGLLEEARADLSMAASVGVIGLAYPDGAWAERCLEAVVHTMTITDPLEDSAGVAAGGEMGGDDDEDPWGIDDVPLDDEQPVVAVLPDHPGLPDRQALPDRSALLNPEDLARARGAILGCASLHLAIMIRGHVSACLASPPLLSALGETLLRSPDKTHSDDCAALLSSPHLYTPPAPGVEPIHELFRRTAHTVRDVGMDTVAMAWVYEFLGVPLFCRRPPAKRTALRWLAHLDRVVLGEARGNTAFGDLVGLGEHGFSAKAGDVAEPEPEAEAGWGESDVELGDDDEAHGEEPATDCREPKPVLQPRAEAQAVLDQRHAAAAAEDGWGDDDDIDLDADLDGL